MPFLQKFRLANWDARIVRNLRGGGKLADESTQKLTMQFIHQALADKDVRKIATTYGFTESDLYVLYNGMLLPLFNPLIRTADGPEAPVMMVASLPFMEPLRLDAMLRAISHDFRQGMDQKGRWDVIARHAKEHGRQSFFAHANARGEPDF